MKTAKQLLLLTFVTLFTSISYADKIAIIGGGGSGLVSAWLLEQYHDVTLYEASDKLGGHADSIDVIVDGVPVTVDAGAEFFNEEYYPHFLKLLRFYEVPLRKFTLVTTFYKTDGSDEIILPPFYGNTVEWKSLTPRNIARSVQMKLVIDKGRHLVEAGPVDLILSQFLKTITLKKSFKNDFFYPMLASAWGASIPESHNFLAYNALKYLVAGYDAKNYQWYEVNGGMRAYIETVRDGLQHAQIKLNAKVQSMGISNGRYTLLTKDGSYAEYDHIIFATNAETASAILKTLPDTAAIGQLLSKVNYYNTKIAIHSDARFMPEDKEDWRVINIRYNGKNSAMTMYKKWRSKTPIFKTWLTFDVRAPKDKGSPMPGNLYGIINYRHIAIDQAYFNVRKQIDQIQGNNNLWYAGTWTYVDDSHESAITSAVNIAKRLAPKSDRLRILTN